MQLRQANTPTAQKPWGDQREAPGEATNEPSKDVGTLLKSLMYVGQSNVEYLQDLIGRSEEGPQGQATLLKHTILFINVYRMIHYKCSPPLNPPF